MTFGWPDTSMRPTYCEKHTPWDCLYTIIFRPQRQIDKIHLREGGRGQGEDACQMKITLPRLSEMDGDSNLSNNTEHWTIKWASVSNADGPNAPPYANWNFI